ncbi:pre-rRNA-processing protein IPI3 [Sporothrix brasiliensis 5110]|uniref:Pre-rRNA-processing protein IPI3 n=1 Tax=Sporothrix brasiliensis 5110 TaxID=1398154 RepID=A0A0C2IW86_9PEZI|nr:pre-rRNA-processing protein IPI3 [Sporothrix brasiliensis 5110]KIH89247.1 pre-rRNA-processing protein IPI3 [Sporothrix brasiliensis 5110]
MLSEDFFAAVCGPPLTSNTAIARDVNIYHQTLSPAHSVQATFKKSATPVGGLAVSTAHVFAAQQDRAYVHVYSRLRGGQETFVPMPDKVRCVTLAGDDQGVLVAGTVEGRLILWETRTGRLVTTPPCHVQAVTTLASTPYHILSGSEDSNVHVWSLPQLLALGAKEGEGADEAEPERTLARHRTAVTSLAVGGSSGHLDTNLCVSASRDKTLVLWNYQTGVALRTLLLPAVPLCVVLDPVARALYVSTDDESTSGASASGGSLFAVELFGDRPLLGARAAEASSTAVSVSTPFGTVPSDAGPASCLTVSYDGATLLSGHPKGRIMQWNLGDAGEEKTTLPVELSNLNAAVTNVMFVPPALPSAASVVPPQTSIQTVVKPSQMGRDYTVTARFDEVAFDGLGGDADADVTAQETAAFDALINQPGFPADTLDKAILAFQQQLGEGAGSGSGAISSSRKPAAAETTISNSDAAEADLRRQNAELLEIVNEQQALYQEAIQRYTELKASRS